jgi:hypothetical protein
MTLPRLKLLSLFLMLGIASACPALASQYYVSPTGTDSNDGTSSTSPWQSIAKVNSYVFPQGSTVSFQGGQTFSGCLTFNTTNVPSSSASAPFTVNSYGAGMATISSSCTGTYSAAITGDNVNGFTVNGLRFVNGSTTTFGVFLQNSTSSSATQTIVIENSEVTGFTGGEIHIIGDNTKGTSGPLNNVQILTNTLHGASVTSADGPGIGGYGYGQNITNVLVQGNTIYNLGMPSSETGAGLTLDGWNGATVQYNVVHDVGANVTSCGGTSGIESYTSSNLTIQFNEVYNIQAYPNFTNGCDWDGIDLDGATTNSIVQYNYIHETGGAALLAYVPGPRGTTWGGNTYRYNIAENSGLIGGDTASFSLVKAVPQTPVYVYGNTFFNNVAHTNSNGRAPECFYIEGGTYPSGSLIEDNICDLNDQNGLGQVFLTYTWGSSLPSLSLNNNLYFTTHTPAWDWGKKSYSSISAWRTAAEPTAVYGDPLFTSAGSGGVCSWAPASLTGPQPCPQAYTLRSGSPALGAGIDVSNNGGRNYYGTALPNPPDIGAQ